MIACRAVPCRRVDNLCSELCWVVDRIDITPLRTGYLQRALNTQKNPTTTCSPALANCRVPGCIHISHPFQIAPIRESRARHASGDLHVTDDCVTMR